MQGRAACFRRDRPTDVSERRPGAHAPAPRLGCALSCARGVSNAGVPVLKECTRRAVPRIRWTLPRQPLGHFCYSQSGGPAPSPPRDNPCITPRPFTSLRALCSDSWDRRRCDKRIEFVTGFRTLATSVDICTFSASAYECSARRSCTVWWLLVPRAPCSPCI